LPEICTPEELAWLANMGRQEYGYIAPAPMGNGRYCCIVPFAFTFGIISGRMFDDLGLCRPFGALPILGKALTALFDWAGKDFEGEPQGWHRHPDSGRRRPDGDPNQEYINC
jgi:hypothetical protein